MSILIETTDKRGLLTPALDTFLADCRSLGLKAEKTESSFAGPVIRAASPSIDIVVQLDPETLRSIFEYAVALIAAYKVSSLVSDFVKVAVTKLDDTMGEKLGQAITKLWKMVFQRLKEVSQRQEEVRVYLSIKGSIEGAAFKAEALLSTDDFEKLNEKELEWLGDKAAAEILLYVIPVSVKIAEEAVEYNRQFRGMHAILFSKREVLDQGQWKLSIDEGKPFMIEAGGSIRGPLGSFRWEEIPKFVAKMMT